MDNYFDLPEHLAWCLSRLKGVRCSGPGQWNARCPVPTHGGDGDRTASLSITFNDRGRILFHCHGGCAWWEVRDWLGLDSYLASLPPSPGGSALIYDDLFDGFTPGADAETLDAAYGALLRTLALEEGDREHLLDRGLSEQQIREGGYRTLRHSELARAGRVVALEVGDEVLDVPGFGWTDFGVTVHSRATGLLVPVRDVDGSIQALKIRQRDGISDNKYVYLSGPDGKSPGAPIHVPVWVPRSAAELTITEGELKSDVITARDRPAIGVPGVHAWKDVFPILKQLGTTTVVLAFDMDMETKPPVWAQVTACREALLERGYNVEMEIWE